jgi:hypothetical protein
MKPTADAWNRGLCVGVCTGASVLLANCLWGPLVGFDWRRILLAGAVAGAGALVSRGIQRFKSGSGQQP